MSEQDVLNNLAEAESQLNFVRIKLRLAQGSSNLTWDGTDAFLNELREVLDRVNNNPRVRSSGSDEDLSTFRPFKWHNESLTQICDQARARCREIGERRTTLAMR